MLNKFFFLLCLSFLVLASCTNTKKQENDEPLIDSSELRKNADHSLKDTADHRFLSDMILAFIKAYNEQDEQKTNSYIHPDVGVIFIHRPGAMDWFEKVSKINFDQPVPSYFPYAAAANEDPITFDTAPKYDCATEKWSRQGLFVDLITQTNLLAPIAESLKVYEDVELDPNYQQQVEMAEKDSYRVVLTSKIPLIFHIKQIDDNWYVTILDRGYADCGA